VRASWRIVKPASGSDYREAHTVVLFRAVTYAALFIGFVLVFLPAQVLRWAGVARPAASGVLEVAALLVGAAGAALALWCVLAFALVGKGTPAPFDPPRRLVVRGPYRVVRNPMYLGAALALAAAALFYRSFALLGFTAAFVLAAHLFVVWYEEPTLRRIFGDAYDAYRRDVRRWWPRP
jgi:protein-S-isoprenylcysteine O-methyltransferase Ste14